MWLNEVLLRFASKQGILGPLPVDFKKHKTHENHKKYTTSMVINSQMPSKHPKFNIAP